MAQRVTYIISKIDKALAFEWIAQNINSSRFQLNFILLNEGDSALEYFLRERKIPVLRIPFKEKKDVPFALLRVLWQLILLRPDVVHCHLFDANIVGLTAAWLLRIPQRIYTRHHSTYHHQYFPQAIKYDRYCNFLATKIIAITGMVRNVLVEMENVSPAKIEIVHHGFELRDFENVAEHRIALLHKKFNPDGKRPVIGVISRYTIWKGIQHTIEAYKIILREHPQALLVLANANGNYKNEIQSLLATLPTGSYCEITFEQDLFALYRLFDVFVHVPIDNHSEAFGQTYVEALAAGVPSVFTLSGIASDFIENEKNALVVPFENHKAIAEAVLRLLRDDILRKQLKENGKASVQTLFALPVMIHALEKIYAGN